MSNAWQPPRLQFADGSDFAVRHVWCVGRNYAAHAREMGVDPDRQPPTFFSKPAMTMHQQQHIVLPADCGRLEHEVELVVLLGAGGRHLGPIQWMDRIAGYAVGVDLTRRDLQQRLKADGLPWELSKGFDASAPVGELLPAGEWTPSDDCRIRLAVNGQWRQDDHLGAMIWSVGELLARLSAELTLHPGDAVFTGTPAGVGPLAFGDHVQALIDGLPALDFRVSAQ